MKKSNPFIWLLALEILVLGYSLTDFFINPVKNKGSLIPALIAAAVIPFIYKNYRRAAEPGADPYDPDPVRQLARRLDPIKLNQPIELQIFNHAFGEEVSILVTHIPGVVKSEEGLECRVDEEGVVKLMRDGRVLTEFLLQINVIK